MNNKEPYDPIPEIKEQLLWAIARIKQCKGTQDELKLRKIAEHHFKELLSYIIV